MAGKSAILTIKILTDASKAASGMDQATSRMDKFKGGISRGAKIGGAALVGLGAAATKATLAAEEVASANARVGQTLENAGMGKATDRVLAYADSLESSLGVDEKVIKNTQAKLGTFHNLAGSADEAGGAFDRATVAAIDMAAAGFGDAESNAVQLGKALQDPVKGITALNRSGVTFTDSQKKMIESMVKTGDMAGAQDLILGELENQIGGTAKATADDSAKMALGFQEVGETIGAALLPIMSQLTPYVQQLATWMQQNADKALLLGGVIAGVAAAFVLANAALKIYQATMLVVNGVVKVATGVMKLFNLVMKMNPIGLVITAIMALIAVFVLLWNKNAAFRNFFINSWNAIKKVASAVWKGIKVAVSVVIKAITVYIKTYAAVVKLIWKAIKTAAAAAWNGIKSVVKTVANWMKSVMRGVKTVILAIWKAIKTGATAAWNGIKSVIRTVTGWIKTTIRAVKTVVMAVWTAIRTGATSAWRGVKSIISTVVGWIKSAVRGMKTVVNNVWSAIKSAASTAWKPIEGIIDGVKSAIDKVVNAAKSVVDWFGRIKFPSIHWPTPPKWLSKINPFKATYDPSLAGGTTTGGGVQPFGFGGPMPRLAAGASSGGGSINITINGGLSSSSDIARAVRRVVRTDARRRGGIVIDRTRQQAGI